ncbi:hypothetical protein [Luteococcus sp.]|uniref:hypothetical protein n=1 Tax=Luteococcus sp. TaxID=1969402 RepID=UPI0037359754
MTASHLFGSPQSTDYWEQLFKEELRRRGASGREVGEAWAMVESHCAETGESCNDAFGDPTDYAIRLTGRPRPALVHRSVVATLLMGLALWTTPSMPLEWNTPVTVTWGTVSAIVTGALAFGLIAPAWRLQRRNGCAGSLMIFVVIFGWTMLRDRLDLWTTPAFSSPGWLLWTILALCAVAATIETVRSARDRAVDPVRNPRPSRLGNAAWTLLGLSPLLLWSLVLALHAL